MPFASVEVFCSYAEQDASFLEQLEDHLSVLRRSGTIVTWHRRKVIAGSDWEHELDHHLQTAPLILLLISPDFLASDYQYGMELQRAMQRHQANEARVIPIVVRPCDWKGAPFEKLQIVPRNEIPLTLWRNRDAGFTEVAKEIRIALEAIPTLTVSTSSTAFPRIWQIPYPRNPVFTGREDLLQTLANVFRTDHLAVLSQPQTQAISGLGGIGKTQLAVEYAYRAAHRYQAVFWVSAVTQETLQAGYTALAEALNLPEKDEQDQSLMLQAVRRWLQTHTNWLLILDNADDLSLVVPFLPPMYGGHILLTTRAQSIGRFAAWIEVDTLALDVGALLLLRRTGLVASDASLEVASPSDLNIARAITEELGGLPLALDQAGAYIEETECSLANYQYLYREQRTELLRSRRGLVDDHPESVATTWALSFEHVERRSPAAADLLRLCAFLAADAIPEELLTEAAEELGDILAPVAADAYLRDQAISVLRAYSLVVRDPQAQTLTVHRLVQAVLRDSMPAETQQAWMRRVVLAVNAAFPHGAFESWSACERLLPHSLVCATWIEQARITTAKAAHLLFQTGLYLDERARYVEAELLYQRALSIREQSLGPEHPDVAALLNNLASSYRAQGKHAEAELLYQRALHIREQSQESESSDVAYPLTNLATLYLEQGKYTEAEPLYQRALRIREQSQGPEHPDVAYPLNGLANLYSEQGRYEEAELLYQRALSIREQSLGPEHPDVADSLNGLATLYREQGKYEEAESLYQRALRIREQSLGPEYPSVADSLNGLAIQYKEQGKYEEAEPLYQRALRIKGQSLGLEHPDVADSLNGLAELYREQGRYAEAEPLYQRALRICEQSQESESSDVAYPLNNLANLYYSQGRYAEAEPLYQRALRICEQSLGSEHPDVVASLNGLAALCRGQGKYAEAEPLYQRALRICEQSLWPEHPDVADLLNNLAILYGEQGKYTEAEQLYQRALRIREQRLGSEHPDVVDLLNNLALLYYSQGRYEEAEPLYQRALRICEQSLGPEHPDVADSLNGLANLYSEQDRYEEAELLYQRALRIREQRLGPEHPSTQAVRKHYTTLLQSKRLDTKQGRWKWVLGFFSR